MSVYKPPTGGGNPLTEIFDIIRLVNNLISFSLMIIELVKKWRASRKPTAK